MRFVSRVGCADVCGRGQRGKDRGAGPHGKKGAVDSSGEGLGKVTTG